MPQDNHQCFAVPVVERDEHIAIKAVYDGTASPSQQRLALHVIVNKFARAHDVLFIPGSSDATAFLEGRGYVGSRILKYLNLPVGKLKEDEKDVLTQPE